MVWDFVLLCINVWLSQQNSKPKHQEPTRADYRSHAMLSVDWLKWTTSCLLINSCFMFCILVVQSLSLFYLILLFKLGCGDHLWGFSAAFSGWTSWSIKTKSVLTTKSGPNGSWNFGRWPVDLGNGKQRMAHKGKTHESKERCPLYSCVQSDCIEVYGMSMFFARFGDVLWDPPLDTRTTFLVLGFLKCWLVSLCFNFPAQLSKILKRVYECMTVWYFYTWYTWYEEKANIRKHSISILFMRSLALQKCNTVIRLDNRAELQWAICRFCRPWRHGC